MANKKERRRSLEPDDRVLTRWPLGLDTFDDDHRRSGLSSNDCCRDFGFYDPQGNGGLRFRQFPERLASI